MQVKDWYHYFYVIAREQGNTSDVARQIAVKMSEQYIDVPYIQY